MGFFNAAFTVNNTTDTVTNHPNSSLSQTPTSASNIMVSVDQMTELMSEMLIAMLNGDPDNIEKGKAIVTRIFPDEAQREVVKKSLEGLESKFQEAGALFATQLTTAIEAELKKEVEDEEQKLYGGTNEPVVSPAALIAKYAKRRHEKRGKLVG